MHKHSGLDLGHERAQLASLLGRETARASAPLPDQLGQPPALVWFEPVHVLAGQDRVIDNARTRALAARFRGPVEVVEYPDAHHTLEFDSTVNYPLDRREVATSDADRAQRTPWNTYVSQGLPATAICSPGVDALRAAEHPEPGDWLYFVTIDAQGTTLFTRDYKQHLANIELAKHNGVLDSTPR